MIESYKIESEVIPVMITKSPARKKSITMKIDEKGIHFMTPMKTKDKSLLDFLNKKNSRVLKNWKESKEKLRFHQEFKNGEAIPFQGEKFKLNVHPYEKKRSKVVFDEGAFHCLIYEGTSRENRQEEIDKAMKTRYLNEATEILVEETRRIAVEYGLRVDEIIVKNYRAKYGQCKGFDISYNYKIIQLPMSIIRHIVIHELAHIKHKNHGPDFRNFVQEMDPLMMTNKRRLKKHGVLLE